METGTQKNDTGEIPMGLDLLFKSKEWLEIKTGTLKTEKLLTRTEFLKEVGWEKFTEEFYQQYLKAMGQQNEWVITRTA